MHDPSGRQVPFDADAEGSANPANSQTGAPNTPWGVPQRDWQQAASGLPPTPGHNSPSDHEGDGLSQQEAEWLRTSLAQTATTPPPRRRFLRTVAAALLLVAGAFLGVAASHNFWRSPALTAVQVGRGNSVTSKVDPALVDINLTLGDQSAEAAATGIVLTANGLVLTNNHVVEGATAIRATDLANGRSYSATVLGYDISQDVALIQLQGASGLKTAQLGDSSAVTVGQTVVGIGNAGGVGGTPSTARGSVVALDQQITAGDELDGTSEQLAGLIETNADIQPGDSGGPLVNASGQVIAMDTATSGGFSFNSTSTQNQSFAIPINNAMAVVSQIESDDSSATVHIGPTAFLGVQFDSSADQGGLGYGFGGLSSSGATIVGVVPGTPAAQAGLTAGDTIVSLDGQAVASSSALTSLVGRYQPGAKVTIGWSDSSGDQHTSTVALASGLAH